MTFFFFFNDTATTEIYTLSLHDALPISHAGGAERLQIGRPHVRRGERELLEETERGPDLGIDRRGAPISQHRLDRKSTRLNSSHSQISYAVFCLKKKKKELSDITGARPH